MPSTHRDGDRPKRAGRVLVSLLELVVAMLSLTGLILWARKRTARQCSAKAMQLRASASPVEAAPLGISAKRQAR